MKIINYGEIPQKVEKYNQIYYYWGYFLITNSFFPIYYINILEQIYLIIFFLQFKKK